MEPIDYEKTKKDNSELVNLAFERMRSEYTAVQVFAAVKLQMRALEEIVARCEREALQQLEKENPELLTLGSRFTYDGVPLELRMTERWDVDHRADSIAQQKLVNAAKKAYETEKKRLKSLQEVLILQGKCKLLGVDKKLVVRTNDVA